MNINKTILEETKDNYYKYNCDFPELWYELFNEIGSHHHNYDCDSQEPWEEFIKKIDIERKYEIVEKIVEKIIKDHGKQQFVGYLAYLGEVEKATRNLKEWYRDHEIHSLQTFLLGIYIYEKHLNPILENDSNKFSTFQWKLASLFHDIAYPLQIASEITNSYVDNINSVKEKLDVLNFDLKMSMKLSNDDSLISTTNSLELIQKRLKDWNLKIDAKKEYYSMVGSGKICHGILSSLTIMHVIGLLYQKYNPRKKYGEITEVNADGVKTDWNQKYFDEDVVSACTAIFIHNLDEKCFENAKIDPKASPIAFLLRLSDTLQEWDRPSSRKRKSNYLAEDFDIKVEKIEVSNDKENKSIYKLIFKANTNEENRKKIKTGILGSISDYKSDKKCNSCVEIVDAETFNRLSRN